MTTNPDLQAKVNEALDNAVDNGYTVWLWPAAQIAKDMTRHDAALEKEDVWELVPYIQAWQEQYKAEQRGKT